MSQAEKKVVKKAPKVTTIEMDAVDNLMFEMVKEAPRFKAICDSDIEYNSEGIVQDAFTSFFAHEPQVLEKAEPVQKGIIETMMSLPEYDNLRGSAQYDDVCSALGAMQFAPEMIKQYVELKKKFEEKQKEAQENGEAGPESLDDIMDAKDKSGLRQAMRRGLQKAKDAADEYSDTMDGWGIDKADLQKVPFGKRMEFADKMQKSSRLKKVAELTGKFRNIVHTAAATTPVHGVDEIVDIGISDDVSRMLPTELVKLIETPDLFVADFLEKKLLCYNLKGIQDMGKGPIIACLDNSGSMDGQRIEWGVAVALSLLTLAEKQNRAFGLIIFNGKVAYKKYWPKGTKVKVEEKISIAETAATGGTSFSEPLEAAFAFRKQEPSLKPADFIFITDGDCDIDGKELESVLEQKKKADVRIYSIVINDSNYGSNSAGSLAKFSDQFVCINSLGDMGTIKNLMTQTASTTSSAQKAKK